MSTNANITLVKRDADKYTTQTIYLHWDGYDAHAGEVLRNHYNTLERVEALVALGDLSSIGPILAPTPDRKHLLYDCQDDVCLAYHRDDGRPFEREDYVFDHDNVAELDEKLKVHYLINCQYHYVFDAETLTWTTYRRFL